MRYLKLSKIRWTGWALVTLLVVAAPASAQAKLSEHTFESEGTRINYLVAGEGEPVILIHGFTSSASNNWGSNGVLGRLAQDFRVIAIDARGHGKSDKPHDPAAYGTKMAQDVLNLMDHLGLEKAHIGGYSMGGFLTMKLLTMAPSRFESAVVAGAGWSKPGGDNSLLNEVAASLEAGEGITPLLLALTPEGREPPSEEMLSAMNGMILAQNDPKALVAVIHGMAELSITEDQLRAIKVPTLAIIGELDTFKASVDEMAPRMRDLDVVILEGADHISAIVNPAHTSHLAEGMRDFLAGVCECL